MSVQVLIVGAGPTGLALACQCLQLGIQVRLIDKKPGPSATSKAIGLQYRVSEILACMGVIDRFLPVSGSPTTVNIYAQSRRLVALRFNAGGHESGSGAFVPRPLMIPQSQTEAILGEVVTERGGHVEWGTELINLVQLEERVAARLVQADGTEQIATCDWLVSCEGAHSVARRAVQIEFVGKTYPLAFLMADVELHGAIAAGENHVWMHPEGSFAALPFPQQDRWRLFIETTRRPAAEIDADLPMIEQLMVERTGNASLRVSNPTWISPFRINCRIVDRYRQGRVLLAGDAAHIHSPTGGQGIATGIQDAVNLAWKLARVVAGAPSSLLQTYEQERRAHAREVLRETDRTTSIFFAPTLAMRLLRDWIVLPVLRNEWVQRRMFAKLSQLHVHYRRSELSRDRTILWPFRRGVRAGDRAPDVLLHRRLDAEPISLFELLSSGRPLVFIGPGDLRVEAVQTLVSKLESLAIDAWIVAPMDTLAWREHSRALVDMHGDVARLYGLQGEFVCLIRPDDHVGFIQSRVSLNDLRDYLRHICPSPVCLQ